MTCAAVPFPAQSRAACPAEGAGSAARCNCPSRPLPSTCTGMNGIQFSGTSFISR